MRAVLDDGLRTMLRWPTPSVFGHLSATITETQQQTTKWRQNCRVQHRCFYRFSQSVVGEISDKTSNSPSHDSDGILHWSKWVRMNKPDYMLIDKCWPWPSLRASVVLLFRHHLSVETHLPVIPKGFCLRFLEIYRFWLPIKILNSWYDIIIWGKMICTQLSWSARKCRQTKTTNGGQEDRITKSANFVKNRHGKNGYVNWIWSRSRAKYKQTEWLKL